MIIPLPQYTEPEPDEPFDIRVTEDDSAWVRWYLNVKPWKCLKCEAVMFGRMTYCVYCKFKLGIDTPRPL